MSLTIVWTEIDGYMCEVFCSYEPWTPGNWDEPDSGYFCVEKVLVDGEQRDDLIELIDYKIEDRIFKLCEQGEVW